MKKVFFLGGRDAEMAEIAKILAEAGQEVIDKCLGWGAKASAYAEEIAQAVANGNTPVLVELEIDIAVPEGTVVVDHHNERAGEPASILQVLNLLGVESTRKHQLIGANDSGYIPAMVAMGATAEEIAEIRLADRNAQGITPEQEAEAERAVAEAEVVGRLTIVRMAHSKTATVADRLYGKADQLLILSGDGEANFFGKGAICSDLKAKFEGWGGGSGFGKADGIGYWGGYPNHEEVLNFLKERGVAVGRYFNTTLGLSMLPDGSVSVRTLSAKEAREWLDTPFTNAANPTHGNSLQAITQKVGVDVRDAKGGRVALRPGDQCLVAQITGIPRETREFTNEEIAAAAFEFRLVTVI